MINEHKKGFKAKAYPKKAKVVVEPPKPRNPVAKNATAAIGGGAAGAHKDKKKDAKQGKVKHKKAALAESEGYEYRLSSLLENAISELDDKTKTSYKEKAEKQVKELEPYAKKGEYKDLAQRAIARRKKGLDRFK